MLQAGNSHNRKQSTQPRCWVEVLEIHLRAEPQGFYLEPEPRLDVEAFQSSKQLLQTFQYLLRLARPHLGHQH